MLTAAVLAGLAPMPCRAQLPPGAYGIKPVFEPQSQLLSAPPRHDGTRIALLLPLSGPNAALGAALSNAAQLALFDNADDQVELLPLDSQGTPAGAQTALDQALSQGADIILGPVFAAEVRAIAPRTRQAQIPVLAFTTDKTTLGSGVFSLGVLPDAQVKTVIDYALAQGRTRFGILAPDTELGHLLAEAGRAEVQRQNGELVRVQFYNPGDTDLRTIAQSFADYAHRRAAMERDKELLSGRKGKEAAAFAQANMPYDAVLLPDEGLRLTSLVSMLTFYGLDPGPVKFLGTFRWDNTATAQEPTLEGSWFPSIGEGPISSFQTHYTKSFGPLPKDLVSLAGASYDGMSLAILLAKKGAANVNPANLMDSQGFTGVDGLFRLLPDGTAERGLAVRELIRNGSKETAPAPDKFTPASVP